MKRIPVTLLTGFLGSGKTSLLVRALDEASFKNTALVINEFGEVSIDHLMVADLAENIIELRDGCLCCTIRGDLAPTLRDLYAKRYLGDLPAFDRVVVETSGLADPIPLLHTLIASPALKPIYTIDAVICVVDALNGKTTIEQHETAANQLAMADIVVISKLDLAGDANGNAIAQVIDEINSAAERFDACDPKFTPSHLLDRGLFEVDDRGGRIEQWLHATHNHHDHGQAYISHVIRHPEPLSLAGTSVFLNRVTNTFKDNVLRIKGLARFRERPGQAAIIHAVQDKFYPIEWLDAWPDADNDCRLVFIGKQLDTSAIDEMFVSLCV